MRTQTLVTVSLVPFSLAHSLFSRQSSTGCPSVWSDVAKELQTAFAGCGRDAHGAVRAPFHDCINNGCDGSLVLADECGRAENAGLSDICGKLKNWATKYEVSTADMIQFAGAIAISSCPLGPRVRALVGRKDGTEAAPVGSVPSSKDSVDKILGAFAAKGFSADDVVALLGTHSIAVNVNDDPSQAGKGLDSTPGIYDMKFYSETAQGTAPYSLQSDKLFANDTQTIKTWSNFAEDANAWNSVFTDAWNRFAVTGNDVAGLQDCSSLIPESSTSVKRQAFNARFAQRMSAKFRS